MSIDLKKELSTHDLMIVSSELEKRKKSKTVMYLLWLFLGGIGAHRYYLGSWIAGLLMTIAFLVGTLPIVFSGDTSMTLLLAILGICVLIDGLIIGVSYEEKTEELEKEIIKQVKS